MPLTLVSAPAGFGKSTLLAEWADEDDVSEQAAWVTLDSGDGEAARFWTHVIASLGRVDPAVGTRSLAALRAHPDAIGDEVVPVVVDELGGAPGRLVLILDDYHLAESPALNEQVAAFLRYRPERVQVVVGTRSDPALGVARLRASGYLVELRADDLRFDARELSAFFTGVGITDLTEAEEKRLAGRTGGWPAPLRLAALLIPREERQTFLDSFTGGSRQVVDYLTSDVLDLLAEETREFLLQVSVLRRMSSSLCDAVAGRTGSGDLLAELERANLFVSVDVSGEWYQQHQLFAEALRLELARTRPELVPVLHSRAAAWFVAAGDLESATDHAIAARDVATASRLVAGQLQPMAATGRSAATRRWLRALDWPEALDDPELGFVRAIAATLDSRIEDALSHLEVARTGAADLEDAAGLPLGFRVDFLEGLIGVADLTRAEAAARRAVDTAPSPGWEGVALVGVGQAAYLRGETTEAVRLLRQAVAQIPDANPILLAFGVGNLGLAESALGVAESRADALLDRILAILGAIGADASLVGGILLLARGERERRGGDLRAAVAGFDAAVDALGSIPRGLWLADAHLLRASVALQLGDAATARSAVGSAEEVLARVVDPGNLRDRAHALRRQLTAPVRQASEFGERLSEREADVLRLAAAGLGQRQIADQLFISYNTVKSHLRTSYRKLGVASRADAVARFEALEPPEAAPPTVGSPG